MKIRIDGRAYDQIRPIKTTFDVFEYATGSVLFELGKTKILCAVNFQEKVPKFLKGSKSGWLTAEYSLMPSSTLDRTPRESSAMKQSGRSMEISRLIGRSLRSVVDLKSLGGENTLWIDCDVMQADGGTRTACINAAYLALKQAQEKLLKDGKIQKEFLKAEVASISGGIFNNDAIVDLNYYEDSKAEVDINFVLTKNNDIVEIQGTAEGEPISWKNFEKIKEVVQKGVKQIFSFYNSL